jgi:dTDP-glucose 4,6-dehydratase
LPTLGGAIGEPVVIRERLLVTGGLGFMGSAFVRRLATEGTAVLNVDLGTYAADEERLRDVSDLTRTERLDVASSAFADFLEQERPDLIVHFAAETHVTRGERHPERFFRSNVEGTRHLLEAAESAGVRLIVHISTDEVYGPCHGSPFREEEKAPGEGGATSAYARSKAVADDLARSFAHRVPVIVIRPTNCFGPWQHPEKAVPRWICRAILGEPIPVWGDGQQVRDWMFVEDACIGIETAIRLGRPGEVYNIGPEGGERTNLEVARMVALAAGKGDDAVYLSEYDRPDHDRRYAVDTSKIRSLGWRPATDLEEGLAQTVRWYQTHLDWWLPLRSQAEDLYHDEGEREEVEG